jgi:hypothetical protein
MAARKAASLQELIADLSSPKSAVRRRAAKHIGSRGDAKAGEPLWNAYQKERLDKRTWETQRDMIDALGRLGVREAASDLWLICERNEKHDAITQAAARAWVRITRVDPSDVGPVLRLLEFAKFSVAFGAFEVLGGDRVLVDNKTAAILLRHAARFSYVEGCGDPRFGIAIAAAGWPAEQVRPFLEECMRSPCSGLVHAAESALKRKYIPAR